MKFHVHELEEGRTLLPLRDCDYYFHTMPVSIKKKETQQTFLKELNAATNGNFYFRVGSSVIELCVQLEKDEIMVEALLHYCEKRIKDEMQRVIKLDYLIHCLLKKYGLQ